MPQMKIAAAVVRSMFVVDFHTFHIFPSRDDVARNRITDWNATPQIRRRSKF